MEHFLTTWGYLALFVATFISSMAIPVGADIAIGYAGALASGQLTAEHHMNLLAVILVATLGEVCGSLAGYTIGRVGGRPLVDRAGRYVLLIVVAVATIIGHRLRGVRNERREGRHLRTGVLADAEVAPALLVSSSSASRAARATVPVADWAEPAPVGARRVASSLRQDVASSLRQDEVARRSGR
jgi:hypothetical protein